MLIKNAFIKGKQIMSKQVKKLMKLPSTQLKDYKFWRGYISAHYQTDDSSGIQLILNGQQNLQKIINNLISFINQRNVSQQILIQFIVYSIFKQIQPFNQFGLNVKDIIQSLKKNMQMLINDVYYFRNLYFLSTNDRNNNISQNNINNNNNNNKSQCIQNLNSSQLQNIQISTKNIQQQKIQIILQKNNNYVDAKLINRPLSNQCSQNSQQTTILSKNVNPYAQYLPISKHIERQFTCPQYYNNQNKPFENNSKKTSQQIIKKDVSSNKLQKTYPPSPPNPSKGGKITLPSITPNKKNPNKANVLKIQNKQQKISSLQTMIIYEHIKSPQLNKQAYCFDSDIKIPFKCSICTIQKQDYLKVINCGHKFHLNCFISYCTLQISNNKLPINCVYKQCNKNIIIEDFQNHLSQQLIQKYHINLLQQLQVKPKCSSKRERSKKYGISKGDITNKIYCVKCHEQEHPDLSCQESKKKKYNKQKQIIKPISKDQQKGKVDGDEKRKGKMCQKCNNQMFYCKCIKDNFNVVSKIVNFDGSADFGEGQMCQISQVLD